MSDQESLHSDADDEKSEEIELETVRCVSHPMCRVHNAMFDVENEATPLPMLLQQIVPEHLGTLPPSKLANYRRHIESALLGEDDPRWVQYYIAMLLRGVDVLEHYVFSEDEAEPIANSFALAVAQNRDANKPALFDMAHGIPAWAIAGFMLVITFLFLIITVCFAVIAAKR